ncbi:hypothetical protein PDJAM_G00148170, partial [Pangasius djambal]|nr:hypothetical protein [Pangasius djambal]
VALVALTLLESTICCCCSIGENGLDKYPHSTSCRILASDNAETQTLDVKEKTKGLLCIST